MGEGQTGRLSAPAPCESIGACRTSGRSCSSVMSLRPRRASCSIVKVGCKASRRGASTTARASSIAGAGGEDTNPDAAKAAAIGKHRIT